MFEYFYHEILRKTIVGFGNLFNDIYIKKKNDNNEVFSTIKVPLAYGPTQKFLARLEQQASLNKPVQITLPRMTFEFIGLSYDPSRKLTTTQTFLTSSTIDKTDVKKVYMPVPYNMQFELSIFCKVNDDILQIIEQIVPYFQPSYNLTVNLVESIGEKRDTPVILENITMQDDYDGNFETRRSLIYTLRFTAKTYLFGPVSGSVRKDIIKKSTIGFISGDTNSTIRDLTYSTTPVATKSYLNNVVTTIVNNIGNGDVEIVVDSAASISSISVGSNIVIDDETMQVAKKEANILTVVRGFYDTQIVEHVSGADIKLIVEEDNDLIEFGDDFGFSGSSF